MVGASVVKPRPDLTHITCETVGVTDAPLSVPVGSPEDATGVTKVTAVQGSVVSVVEGVSVVPVRRRGWGVPTVLLKTWAVEAGVGVASWPLPDVSLVATTVVTVRPGGTPGTGCTGRAWVGTLYAWPTCGCCTDIARPTRRNTETGVMLKQQGWAWKRVNIRRRVRPSHYQTRISVPNGKHRHSPASRTTYLSNAVVSAGVVCLRGRWSFYSCRPGVLWSSIGCPLGQRWQG